MMRRSGRSISRRDSLCCLLSGLLKEYDELHQFEMNLFEHGPGLDGKTTHPIAIQLKGINVTDDVTESQEFILSRAGGVG